MLVSSSPGRSFNVLFSRGPLCSGTEWLAGTTSGHVEHIWQARSILIRGFARLCAFVIIIATYLCNSDGENKHTTRQPRSPHIEPSSWFALGSCAWLSTSLWSPTAASYTPKTCCIDIHCAQYSPCRWLAALLAYFILCIASRTDHRPWSWSAEFCLRLRCQWKWHWAFFSSS